jgi:hypothetical protein
MAFLQLKYPDMLVKIMNYLTGRNRTVHQTDKPSLPPNKEGLREV